METYSELKIRHSQEFNNFPICFAFSNEQLEKALLKLGAKKEDCVSIGAGGIVKKTDRKSFDNLMTRHDTEYKDAFKNNAVLIEAIVSELSNHEYGYTYDATDTIEALGLDLDDSRQAACFQTARTQYLKADECN